MPVRAEPVHTAEMVTQLLFGEKAEVLEINDKDWARIHCFSDDYIGWCKIGQLTIISAKEYRKTGKYMVANHQSQFLFENSSQWLPLGADLYGLKLLNTPPNKFKGKKKATQELELTADNLVEAAMQYMNAPYLWGGRSIAGIDCSGLTQMAFKLCGKNILRDASQQAAEGIHIDFLQHAQKGDLAFFENENGAITHVGLLIDNDSIIHATDTSGKVVIDKIDNGGIISKLLRKRTHKLRMIKRYL